MQQPSTTEQGFQVESFFAERMKNTPRSFIREILKVAVSEEIISFAGGLPNPEIFPMEAIREAAVRVLGQRGREALQYSNSEGYLPLRRYISHWYHENAGMEVSPEDILITSGSQQGLDLIGKVVINPGDRIIIEEPGYLGAIQAFSLYQPQFIPVPLKTTGMDLEVLDRELNSGNPRMMYLIPDFQNPSGISYSREVREQIAERIRGKNILLAEDTPYSDIRFSGERAPGFYPMLPEQTILLGTFSKTVVPGFRLGWIVARKELMDKLIIAKQAADLHTNIFTQQLLYDYLINNDIKSHIHLISNLYGRQCHAMLEALKTYFPKDVQYTVPKGGMFLWVTLPEGQSSLELFNRALEHKVAFVPGNPFYVDGSKHRSTLRLNFSCSDEATIFEGVRRIAGVLG
ncbi:MAG: PLP-dependent aminotransferase family protein [Bacteroidales bacterium]|nr:PLP-dependent aminotransferase family protein [Bacteroidales bacterium]